MEVMAGYSKKFAFDELARLFQRYVVTKGSSGILPPEQTHTLFDLYEPTPSQGKSSKIILRKMMFEDEIFGRRVSFSYTWDLFVTLETMFKATGMFLPVEEDVATQKVDWTNWIYDASLILNQGGFQEIGMTEKDDVIISLCNPFSGPVPQQAALPIKKDEKRSRPEQVSGQEVFDQTIDNTEQYGYYGSYHTQFTLESDSGTLTHVPLQYLSPLQETLSTENLIRTSTSPNKMNLIDDLADIEGAIPVIHHKIRPQRHIIHMTGAATRLGSPVVAPHLDSIGSNQAYKIGSDYLDQRVIGNGVDVVTGKNYSIYGLIWRKSYSLDGPPLNYNQKSDGHPQQYI